MTLSVVCAVHNEEDLLPVTLPSIYDTKPDEAIYGLDRCTDRSKELITSESEKHPETATWIKLYDERDGRDWNFRRAFLRHELSIETSGDRILHTAADMRLDPNLNKILALIPRKYYCISLGYLDYPWTIQTFLRKIAADMRIFYGFSGLLAVDRGASMEEDVEDLKKQYIGEDTHLHQAIKGPKRYINTKTLHLRPIEDKARHYRRGVGQFYSLNKSYGGALLHSLLLIRPASFTGYRHARTGRVTAQGIARRGVKY